MMSLQVVRSSPVTAYAPALAPFSSLSSYIIFRLLRAIVHVMICVGQPLRPTVAVASNVMAFVGSSAKELMQYERLHLRGISDLLDCRNSSARLIAIGSELESQGPAKSAKYGHCTQSFSMHIHIHSSSSKVSARYHCVCGITVCTTPAFNTSSVLMKYVLWPVGCSLTRWHMRVQTQQSLLLSLSEYSRRWLMRLTTIHMAVLSVLTVYVV